MLKKNFVAGQKFRTLLDGVVQTPRGYTCDVFTALAAFLSEVFKGAVTWFAILVHHCLIDLSDFVILSTRFCSRFVCILFVLGLLVFLSFP